MRQTFFASLFLSYFLALSLWAKPQAVPSGQRVLVDLDSGWKFIKGNPSQAQDPDFDDSGWANIDLPHTWNNLDGQDGGCDYYRGLSWYRRHYRADQRYVGKKFFLQFDGANQITTVYVNGQKVGTHQGGYAAFNFDVTPYLSVEEDNVIAISVDNSLNNDIAPLSADYTFFGGIYRPLRLVVTDTLHVTLMDYGSCGLYLSPSNVSETSADLAVTLKAVNERTTAQAVTARVSVQDASGREVKALSAAQTLEPGQPFVFVMKTTLENPHLWNGLQDPYLYRVKASLSDETGATDWVEQPLGFRFYRVDPEKGFFLNGHALDLHGLCRHQDRPNQGWAITDAQTREDFDILTDIGSTCVRLSHYQQSQAAYDYSDQKGLVLWTEIPLINNINTSQAFSDNCVQQLTELIRQNMNHPSVFFWGLYNEILLKKGPDPEALVQKLNYVAHQEDPGRLTVCAINGSKGRAVNWITDVCSFNIYSGWYVEKKEDFAHWADDVHSSYSKRAVGVSEYGAGANIHQHEEDPAPPKPDGPYHPEEYQNLFHETYWLAMKTRPFLWWKSVWNAFDFASDCRKEGSAPGLNDKGITTYDRKTHKDAYYWYKANWSKDPFCYVTSRRYNQRTISPVELKVYSNCETVEAFVNGMSLGKKTSLDHRFIWKNVQLEPCDNRIESVGISEGKTYSDSCVWSYANGKPCGDSHSAQSPYEPIHPH